MRHLLAQPGVARQVYERVRETLTQEAVAGFLFQIVAFVVIILVGYLLGALVRGALRSLRRGAPTGGEIMLGRAVQVFLVVLAGGVALSAVYQVDPIGVLAAVGLVSLALGFGLQATVANLAAGVSLTIDRPFEVGDRIRVGKTWGDVVSIGLRSTRILTVSGEHVVVPNSVLDHQEVWNFTEGDDRRLRVDLPLGISYGSSLAMAEQLALEVARDVPGVLAYPPPVVRFRGFGESGVDLELRVWIESARDRPGVQDRMVRGVKRAYDAKGVHFPFPQRTLSYLRDLGEPATAPELEAEGPRRPLALVVLSETPNRQVVERIAEFAIRTGARLHVLHVRPRRNAYQTAPAQDAVNRVVEAAERRGVPTQGHHTTGSLPAAAAEWAKRQGAALIILGDTSRRRPLLGGHKEELTKLRMATPVPVLPLDGKPLDEDEITWWADLLQRQHDDVAPAPMPEDEEEGQGE